MTILKFSCLGICFSLTILMLKNISKEFALYASIAASCVMLFFIVDLVFSVWDKVQTIFDNLKVSGELLKSAGKVVGIGYLTEIAANVSADAEEKSIAEKIRLFGKIAILSSCLPLISKFVEMILGIV